MEQAQDWRHGIEPDQNVGFSAPPGVHLAGGAKAFNW